MLSFLVKNQNLLSEFDIRTAYGNVIAEKLSQLNKYGSFYYNRGDVESTAHGLKFDVRDLTYEQIVAKLEKTFNPGGVYQSEDMEIKNNYSWAKNYFFGFKPGNKTEFKLGYHGYIQDVLQILAYAVTGKPEKDLKTGFQLKDQYGLTVSAFNVNPSAYDQKNIKELGIVIKQFKNGKVLVGGLKSDALARLEKMRQVLTGK